MRTNDLVFFAKGQITWEDEYAALQYLSEGMPVSAYYVFDRGFLNVAQFDPTAFRSYLISAFCELHSISESEASNDRLVENLFLLFRQRLIPLTEIESIHFGSLDSG